MVLTFQKKGQKNLKPWNNHMPFCMIQAGEASYSSPYLNNFNFSRMYACQSWKIQVTPKASY